MFRDVMYSKVGWVIRKGLVIGLNPGNETPRSSSKAADYVVQFKRL